MKYDIIENFPQLNILKSLFLEDCGIIAGGCFRAIFLNEKVKDYDMFFRSKDDFDRMNEAYKKNENWEEIYRTGRVIGYYHKHLKIRVELVFVYFGLPEEIINNFDFSIAKFALYTKHEYNNDLERDIVNTTYHVCFVDNFFEHLMLKKLVIDDKIILPINTFQRMIKYCYKYGFNPCRETKLKLLAQLRLLPEKEDIQLSKELYESFD